MKFIFLSVNPLILLVLRVENKGKLVRKEARKLRDRFLAWQCRLRQAAVREDGGRHSPGMRPRVLDAKGDELAVALTVLLVPNEPDASTAFFRFQVMRSADARDIYERALRFLQAEHFQDPAAFSDELVAALPERSPVAVALIAAEICRLDFEQSNQRFALQCTVRALAPGEPAREAALWHNRLFNPALPNTVEVLTFKPDWASTETREGSR
jgi:hypothetical protein